MAERGEENGPERQQRTDDVERVDVDREHHFAAMYTPAGRNGAAKESNLPTVGLPRPAGFEDRMGHQTPAAPAPMLEP